jgi:hypothetical protein
MAVQPAHEDRMVAGHGIDELSRGEPLAGPGLVVPVPLEDPRPLRQRLRVVTEAVGEVGLVPGLAKVHREQAEAAVEEVDVSVVEAGHDEASLQLDDPGLRPDEGGDVDVAHGKDALAPQGDRSSLAQALARPHAAAAEDDVGRLSERHATQKGGQDRRAEGGPIHSCHLSNGSRSSRVPESVVASMGRRKGYTGRPRSRHIDSEET